MYVASRGSLMKHSSTEKEFRMAPHNRLPATHHWSVVGLCKWLVVWPAAILLAVLTAMALFFPVFPIAFVFIGIGWWGIGSLFTLHSYLVGGPYKPSKASWYGVFVASLSVAFFGLSLGRYLQSLDPNYAKDILWVDDMFLLWPIGCCIPTGLHWLWLAHKAIKGESTAACNQPSTGN